LRLGDPTLRKLHYQTGLVTRQPLAGPPQIATIDRDELARRDGINRGPDNDAMFTMADC
jgi:hypothetical protein